jgi:hypothetical protein
MTPPALACPRGALDAIQIRHTLFHPDNDYIDPHKMQKLESIIAKRALDNLKSHFYAVLCILRPDTKPIKNILANIPARRLRISPFYQ